MKKLNSLKQIYKYIAMMPIFWFIGCGVLLSLDIMQPSMFADIPANATIFTIALAIGFAPVLLVTNAINSLLQKEHTKLRLLYAVGIVFIFMLSEIVYSYTSVKGFFGDHDIPMLKIIGVLFLPLTFSLYYFVSLFNSSAQEDIPAVPNSGNVVVGLEIKELPEHVEIQQLLKEREDILAELKSLGADTFVTEINSNVGHAPNT